MTEDKIHELYKHNLPIIEGIVDKKSELLSSWIKNIITLLVGLLSVLVAFKSNETETEFIHLLFSQTLILLGLSVISGVVFLYSEIEKLNRHESFHWESLRKRLGGNEEILTVLIKDKKIFVFFSWLFYISSVTSVISLIWYGIMKN
nr:hypothetical protein [uncultured Flavobacterium sp.]